jgi:flavin-dependent dehydrogenase
VAAALAQRGHSVVLLDKASFPRHKTCSEYINPGAVQVLAEIGMLDEVMRAGAHRMDAMVIHAPNGNRFVTNFAKAEPGKAALGLSRYRFDALLLDHAIACGVEVIERAHVRSILQEDGCVIGVDATVNGTHQTIRSAIVIGADGHNSVVARGLNMDIASPWPSKTGLAAHYRGVTDLQQFGEMHVGRHIYAGLAPLEDGIANVAVVANQSAVQARSGSIEDFFSESVRSFPKLASKLEAAEKIRDIRGVGGMAHRARRTAGDGYLLVGDAASFLDPFTGDGIYEALRGAHLAAPIISAALRSGAVSANALKPYGVARRHTFTMKREVSWIVQGFVNTPLLMNYVTARLARREDLGLTLSGVLGNFRPASQALSPAFLVRLLMP